MSHSIVASLSIPVVFFALWQGANVIISILYGRHDSKTDAKSSNERVAILYTTCNDFRPDACETLLEQTGVSCDIFILDDSDEPSVVAAIDDWCKSKDSGIRVLRRGTRRAYKAGNLNAWLRSQVGNPADYPYFLVVDADERVPGSFCAEMLDRIKASGTVFIQASHQGTAQLDTLFQRLLHSQVDCIWRFSVPARQAIGVPTALGHGVLFRTDAIQKLGGFPEIVSEDLGLTICLAEGGAKGEIATDIIAEEAFPKDYAAYWRRRCRWIQGDAEVLKTMLGPLAKSRVSFVAKLDLFLRELRLPMGSLYWVLLMFIALGGAWTPLLRLPVSGWLITVLFLLPAVCVLSIRRLPVTHRLLYLVSMPVIGLATSAIYPIVTLRGLFGAPSFAPTGATEGRGSAAGILPFWEVASGALFVSFGVVHSQWIVAAVGLPIIFSPVMRSRFEMAALGVSVVGFWSLIALQIVIDLSNGFVPAEHILALSGLTMGLE
jgi:cellulose synthase/poly-beta-1,6-N-acetylglucosamine synthase-like glycosyltransferase